MELNTLLILFGSILLILVLSIIYRKKIILFYYIKVYGLYSSKFVDTYKSFYKMNPFPHAAKSEMSEYLDFYLKSDRLKHFVSSDVIKFDTIAPGDQVNNITKLIGEPDYFSIRKIGKFSVKIYGYDVIIFDLNAIALYFVYNGIFFLGEFTIRRDKQKFQFEVIAKKIIDKYCSDSNFDLSDSFIIDGKQGKSILMHDDGFAVRLKYFSSKEDNVLSILSNEQMNIKSSFVFAPKTTQKVNY